MKNTFNKLIWVEIRQQGWRYSAYMLVIALSGLVSILPPKLYSFFLENISGPQGMTEISAQVFLEQLVVFGIVIAVVMFVSNVVRVVYEEWICLRIEGSLRRRFMSLVHKLSLESLDGAQRGDWLTRMSGDVRTVEQFIALKLPQQCFDFVIMLAISVLFIQSDGWVSVFLLLSALGIATYNYLVQRKIIPMLDQLRDLHGQVFQGLLENYEGIRSIRSYRAENFVLNMFYDRVQSIIKKGMSVIRLVGLVIGSNALVVNLLTTGLLSLMAWKLQQKTLLVHDVLIYPFYIGMFYNSVFALVRGLFDWNDFFIHSQRLTSVIDDAIRSSQTPVVEGLKQTQGIEIKGLTLGYESSPLLTVPFDFSLRKGEIVLLKGDSGSGKSTMLEVLAGLRAFQADSITLSDSHNNQTTALNPKISVRLPIMQSTYVEQMPFLFEGNLRNNLTLNKESNDDALVWDALKSVHLYDFVKERGGLSLFIRDCGSNLSEGQKHRVALARAFLHLRSFILLDEPFAALDAESIGCLCEALERIKQQHGILIVSHVIPENIHFDRVIDFNQVRLQPGFDLLQEHSKALRTDQDLASKEWSSLANCGIGV